MSKLDDNYEVKGTGQEKLACIVKDMDERTCVISVNAPQELLISAVLEKHTNTESPRFVLLTSQTMVPGTLFPIKKEDLLHNRKYKNIGYIPQDSQTMDALREYIPDIEQNGYYLVVRGERKVTIVPSKGFLATLCRRLNTGAIPPGENVFAFCYLATLLNKAEPFQIIARKEAVNSTCYKGYHCASINFTAIPQAIVWNVKKLLEKHTKAKVWTWEITNYVTKVNFLFPEYSQKNENDTFMFGVRYQMSTIGDCSLILQPIVKYRKSVFLYGKSKMITHRVKDENIKDILDEAINCIMEQIPSMIAKFWGVLEFSKQKLNKGSKICIKELLKKADVKIGRKRQESLVAMCPDNLETVYELFIWLIDKINNYPEKLPGYIQNNFEEGIGRLFSLKPEVLGGFVDVGNVK